MDIVTINGVLLTPLKIIENTKGDVYHGMKNTDPGYSGFGEAYFSTINFEEIKPWKKHLEMTLNFVVPVGEIRFVLYDDRPDSFTKGAFFDITLGKNNYKRITIPPGIWVAFSGRSINLNLLMNIANISHNIDEIVRMESIKDIEYLW